MRYYPLLRPRIDLLPTKALVASRPVLRLIVASTLRTAPLDNLNFLRNELAQIIVIALLLGALIFEQSNTIVCPALDTRQMKYAVAKLAGPHCIGSPNRTNANETYRRTRLQNILQTSSCLL